MNSIYYQNSSFDNFSANPNKSKSKELALDNEKIDVKEDIKFQAKTMAVSPNGNASSPIPDKGNERKYIKRVFQPPHITADNRIIHKPNHMNALKSTKEHQKVSLQATCAFRISFMLDSYDNAKLNANLLSEYYKRQRLPEI